MPKLFATEESRSRLCQILDWAPSILNTRPWSCRFVADDRIELRADQKYGLSATDPQHREMVISCGAALFNLRMAIRVTGHDPVVWLIPDEENDRDLLASVEISTHRPHTATYGEQNLYAEIRNRHTVREPFCGRVPMNIVADLEQAARAEKISAVWLLHRRHTRQLLEWTAQANRVLEGDARYRDELRNWAGSVHPDGRGVSAASFGPRPEQPDRTPVRDLGLEWTGIRPTRAFEKDARLMALATETDGPLDWMQTGQALQRLLLTATRYHVVASFLTQPFEVSDRRGRFPPQPWPWPKLAQIVIRLGPMSADVPDTPHQGQV
jgi:hypothetical protein